LIGKHEESMLRWLNAKIGRNAVELGTGFLAYIIEQQEALINDIVTCKVVTINTWNFDW
jgi:hypothetical protein